ncbi:hypothetical protein [Capybara microvirus Cap1_SP_148]|nr:hypothetical protein [Capybara microvirus Cap1_SP_148]
MLHKKSNSKTLEVLDQLFKAVATSTSVLKDLVSSVDDPYVDFYETLTLSELNACKDWLESIVRQSFQFSQSLALFLDKYNGSSEQK